MATIRRHEGEILENVRLEARGAWTLGDTGYNSQGA